MMRKILMAGALVVLFWGDASAADLGKGEKVYEAKNCGLCHGIEGKGGKIGGDLSHIGTKRDGPWLKRFMLDPKTLKPGAMMQPFTGTDDELETLIDYLMSLK